MTNYSQNIANRRFVTNEERLADHLAFQVGRAYVEMWQYVGVKGADEIMFALSKGTRQQRVQWAEWFVDKMRIAGW